MAIKVYSRFIIYYNLFSTRRSFFTFVRVNNPTAKRTNNDAIPSLGDEKEYYIVPKRIGPKNEVTFPEKE